jgi:hypothetical protein
MTEEKEEVEEEEEKVEEEKVEEEKVEEENEKCVDFFLYLYLCVNCDMFLLTTLSIYLLLLYVLCFTASPTGTVCSLLRPKEQIRAAHNTSEAIKCPQCDRYFKTKVLIERLRI